jgi:hypothetical protein
MLRWSRPVAARESKPSVTDMSVTPGVVEAAIIARTIGTPVPTLLRACDD